MTNTDTTTTGLVAYRVDDTIEWGLSTVTTWHDEPRDITADYTRLFVVPMTAGEDPPDAAHRSLGTAKNAARRILGADARFDPADADTADPAAITTWVVR